jgi:2-isopropylmalate synthase
MLILRPMVDELIHNWTSLNQACETLHGIVDETIRDGLQMPNCPPVDLSFKLSAIECMKRAGIEDVIVGMWRADQRDDLNAVLQGIDVLRSKLYPWILCRCVPEDVRTLITFGQETNQKFGLNLFISLSDIRIFAEGWQRNECERRLFECLALGRPAFTSIRVAIEDATRTSPAVLTATVRRLVEFGVNRIALADTAGVAVPGLPHQLVTTLLSACPELSSCGSHLEWHGHNDRGMSVATSIEALMAGVHYVHGTMCGIGERNGNMPIDIFMMNLTESRTFQTRYDWQAIADYHSLVWKRFGEALGGAYPYFGTSSFASATGTHVAAIQKALEAGRSDVAKRLFSPPSQANDIREHQFVVSHLTGKRGIQAALDQRGLSYSDAALTYIQNLASSVRRPLSVRELELACSSAQNAGELHESK